MDSKLGPNHLCSTTRGEQPPPLASDGSYTPEIPEHNYGCCGHVAVTTWRFGAQPPVAQVLAPPNDQAKHMNEQLSMPQLAIGPTSVTALWSAGGTEPDGSSFEALDEAYGRFGEPLQAVQLKRVAHGIQSIYLSLAPNGDPIAAWRQNVDELQSVEGSSTGALPDPMAVRTIPAPGKGVEEEHFSEGNEFSSDPQGDLLFAYLVGSYAPKARAMMFTSGRGRPFGPPRTIATIGPEAEPPVVLGGGTHSLLAFWSCEGPSSPCAGDWARRGAIFGGLGPTFAIGEKAQGFIGPGGRTVIAYQGRSAIEAIVARPGKPFGRPRRISPAKRGCELGTSEEGSEKPAATSRNGHAIFYFSCEESDHQYLVRYAP